MQRAGGRTEVVNGWMDGPTRLDGMGWMDRLDEMTGQLAVYGLSTYHRYVRWMDGLDGMDGRLQPISLCEAKQDGRHTGWQEELQNQVNVSQ